jgi:hypothetical protein
MRLRSQASTWRLASGMPCTGGIDDDAMLDRACVSRMTLAHISAQPVWRLLACKWSPVPLSCHSAIDTSTRQLEAAIRHCVKVNSADPTPSLWGKTAEDNPRECRAVLVCELSNYWVRLA